MTRPHYSSQAPISPQYEDKGGTDWRESAACAQIDPAGADIAFFPSESSMDAHKYDYAVSICRRCPVMAECLADAMATEAPGLSSRHGVRGGLTPGQRHKLARETGGGAA